ncbi:uncharacterized protein LOC112126129 [Cimex lectularius]|uniref:Uncharacterized protein n=1 Tax=Cimex lectularius TaxID=79782 RepID=A0A8I6SNU8_CIMLE|nr:uncharacterized protein LOC112126129 [Cimex lectularius]
MDDGFSDASSGLGDPLARLSDLGSCSSWSGSPPGSPQLEEEIDWERRCLNLQLELQKYKLHSSKVRDLLKDKKRWQSLGMAWQGKWMIYVKIISAKNTGQNNSFKHVSKRFRQRQVLEPINLFYVI